MRSRNNCWRGKSTNITFVCVCALVRACGCPGAWERACVFVRLALLIQHETRMRHIVTSFMAPLASPYISTSQKRHDFRKKKSY